MTNQDILLEDMLKEVEELLEVRVFATPLLVPLREPVFVALVIKLNEVLQILDKRGRRVNFTEDVSLADDVKDVTDLISKVRNAVCHASSELNFVRDKNPLFFNFRYAEIKGEIRFTEEFAITNQYQDDLLILYGGYPIYFTRNLVRAFEEAKQNLAHCKN